MTATLDHMIADLAGGIFEVAGDSAGRLRQIHARLPMEFGLRRGEDGMVVAARPPEETQARDLSTPVGAFTFTIDIAGGADEQA